MQLFIRGTRTHTLQLTGEESIVEIKNQLAVTEGVNSNQLVLYASGQPLSDETKLNSLSDLSSIDLEVGLLGGKVHGSLARAGKVKGQTPKVDKQENKKKKKTGRAKRRLQYNRRFVNVVATFGRRKGPNSNS